MASQPWPLWYTTRLDAYCDWSASGSASVLAGCVWVVPSVLCHPGSVPLAQLADEEDQQWKEDERESTQQLLARAVEFVHWLMSRPEGRLAVVTHSSFLYHLMACFGHQAAPPIPVSHETCIKRARSVCNVS